MHTRKGCWGKNEVRGVDAELLRCVEGCFRAGAQTRGLYSFFLVTQVLVRDPWVED